MTISGKDCARNTATMRRVSVVAMATAATLLNLVSPAVAGPEGGQVAAGSATISQSGANTVIHAANNTIINFQSFNIGALETVQFIQPDASSRVLNRVTGGGVSQIDGALLANGHVYIANPAGIFFGNTAVVNAGSITAAAGNISDANFLANINSFTGLSGSVVNRGSIEAHTVNLIGGKVANFGSIIAPNGMVTIVAGDEVYLSDAGPLMVRVGNKSEDLNVAAVNNEGTINAGAKGSVHMGAADVYALGVRQAGEVRARNVTVSAPKAQVQVTGLIGAWSDDEAGGTVQVLGKEVIVAGEAKINASGPTGGGTILIGGDYHGEGPTPTAEKTLVTKDVEIKADATAKGDGGKVIIWADEQTAFFGSISAKGGPQGGDGGFIEVSADSLVQDGRYDLSAPLGRSGTLLFDPLEITITGGTGDGSDVQGGADNANLFGDTGTVGYVSFTDVGVGGAGATTFLIRESELEGSLATFSVILEARRNIRITSGSSFSDSNGNGQPDIFVYFGSSLTLRTRNNAGDGAGVIDLTTSAHGVNLELAAAWGGTITIDGSTAGNNAANITLGRLYTTDPSLLYGDSSIFVRTRNGSITANGVITAGTGDVTLDAAGALTINQTITGGNAYLFARGGNLSLNGVVTVGSGNIIHAQARDDLGVLRNPTAGTFNALAGTDGSGNLTFAAGVTVRADRINLASGDGRGGTATAAVDALTNTPQFRNNAGTGSPTTFSIAQDAAMTDANLPTVAQLGGNVAGISYSAQSNDSTFTLASAAKTDGTRLALAAGTTLTVSTALSNIEFTAVAATAINLSGNVATSGNQTYLGPLSLQANNITLAGDDINIDGAIDGPGGSRNLVLNASGDLFLRGLIGATSPLNSIDADAAAIHVFTTGITTVANQRYRAPVELRNNATFTATGGNIRFDAPIFSEQVTAVPHSHPLTDHAEGFHFLYTNALGQAGTWHGLTSPPASPTVVLYDFRPVGTEPNMITASQMAMVIKALNDWSDATGGMIVFQRSTSAALNTILNIGVGNLTVVGGTSGLYNTLGIGPSNLPLPPAVLPSLKINSATAWLDYQENWDNLYANGNGNNTTIDAYSVFIHEIGHTLGLAHIDVDLGLSTIMDNAYLGEFTGLSALDVAHVQALYGVGGAARNLTINASGDVALNGAVSGINALTVVSGGNTTTGASISAASAAFSNTGGGDTLTLGGPVVVTGNLTLGGGVGSNFGNVLLNGDITGDTVTVNAPVTLVGDSNITGNTAVNVVGNIEAAGHSLGIIADNPSITGSILNTPPGGTPSGIFTIAPATLNTTIGLESNIAVFNLTMAQLNLIDPDFIGINIGNVNGTGNVYIGTSGVLTTLNLTTPGYKLGLRGGATSFYQAISMASGSTFTLVSNGAGNSVTSFLAGGNDVTIAGASGQANFTVGGALDLDTSVANLSIFKTGAGNVVLNNSGFNLAMQTSSISGGTLTVNNTGGNITDAGIITVSGGASAAFSTLTTNADITLDQLALTGNLVLNTTGATGHASVTNAAGLTLGSSSIGGDLTLVVASGDITQAVGSTVVVGGITSLTTSAGAITLNNTGNNFNSFVGIATLDITLRDASGITLAGGSAARNFTLNAGGDVLLAQDAIDATGNVAITAVGGKIDAVSAGSANTANAEIGFTGTGALALTGNGIGVNQVIDIQRGAAGGSLTLNNTGVSNETVRLNVLTNTFPTINLTLADAGSASTIDLPGADIIALTGGANLVFNGTVLSTGNSIFNLNLTEAGAGVVFTSLTGGSGDLSITTNNGSVTDTAAVTLPGLLSLTLATGNITLNDLGDIRRVRVVSANNLDLRTSAATTLVSAALTGSAFVSSIGNLTIEGALTNSGQVDLQSSGNIAFSGTGGISHATGAVNISATNLAGSLNMANGSLVNAGSGAITILTGGDATLGGVKTTSASSSAVTITAGGAILDGGDAHLEVDAAAGGLVMSAPNGIGLGNPLEINAATLDAVSTGGGINVSDVDSLAIVRFAAAGNVGLSGGAIEGTAGGFVDVSGGNITLNASTIGLNTPLEVAATGWLSATAGYINISHFGNLVINRINATGGTVVINSTGDIDALSDDNTADILTYHLTLNGTSIGQNSTLDVFAARSFNAAATSGDIIIDFALVIPPGTVTGPGVIDLELSIGSNVAQGLPDTSGAAYAPTAQESAIAAANTALTADNESEQAELLKYTPSRTASSPAQFGVTSLSTIERVAGLPRQEFRGVLNQTITRYNTAKADSLVANTPFDAQEYLHYLQYGHRKDNDAAIADRQAALAGLREIQQQLALMGLTTPAQAAARLAVLRTIAPDGVDVQIFEQAVLNSVSPARNVATASTSVSSAAP